MTSDTAADESSRAWPPGTYSWYVLAMLIVAYACAMLDRSVITLLVDPIKNDLSISDAQIGLLQGLAFAVCFTTFGLALGYIADRFNRCLLLGASIMLWCVATAACGLAS